MRSSPYTKSCPLTSSRLHNASSAVACGSRFDRKRIHTDVSTRTIMPPNVSLMTLVHVDVASRAREARIREAREDARRRLAGRVPRGRVEGCPYLSSPRMLSSRLVRDARQYATSSSYIRLCHRGMDTLPSAQACKKRLALRYYAPLSAARGDFLFRA